MSSLEANKSFFTKEAKEIHTVANRIRTSAITRISPLLPLNIYTVVKAYEPADYLGSYLTIEDVNAEGFELPLLMVHGNIAKTRRVSAGIARLPILPRIYCSDGRIFDPAFFIKDDQFNPESELSTPLHTSSVLELGRKILRDPNFRAEVTHFTD